MVCIISTICLDPPQYNVSKSKSAPKHPIFLFSHQLRTTCWYSAPAFVDSSFRNAGRIVCSFIRPIFRCNFTIAVVAAGLTKVRQSLPPRRETNNKQSQRPQINRPCILTWLPASNTLTPEKNGQEFADNLFAWWRHQMETFSALLAICAGRSPVTGEFPAQGPVTRSFDVFFDLCLNKRLSKQSWGWWFETPSRPLWRHSNGMHFLHGTIRDFFLMVKLC